MERGCHCIIKTLTCDLFVQTEDKPCKPSALVASVLAGILRTYFPEICVNDVIITLTCSVRIDSVSLTQYQSNKDSVRTCNTEARSCNHCCREKAVGTTYAECVSVALSIQHAQRMRLTTLLYITCLALPLFFHIIPQTARFSGKSY